MAMARCENAMASSSRFARTARFAAPARADSRLGSRVKAVRQGVQPRLGLAQIAQHDPLGLPGRHVLRRGRQRGFEQLESRRRMLRAHAAQGHAEVPTGLGALVLVHRIAVEQNQGLFARVGNPRRRSMIGCPQRPGGEFDD